jgi:hypothetical protein
MPEKIILTTVSAWELGEKFEDARAQKNEALHEAKLAKQDGDLSENAPYQAAKEKFRTAPAHRGNEPPYRARPYSRGSRFMGDRRAR